MKATKVLELLSRNEFDKLRNLCINEIFVENSGGKTDTAKARTKLANKIAKAEKNNRPALAGAYTIDGIQMLCDGYIGAMYNDTVPGLPEPEQQGGIDLRKIIPPQSECKELEIKIDIDDLKNRLKVVKAERPNSSKKGQWLVKIDEAYYDIDLVLDVVPTIAGDLRISRMDSPFTRPEYSPLIVAGENGVGLIMPIRPEKGKEFSAADIVKDYNQKTEFWEEAYYA